MKKIITVLILLYSVTNFSQSNQTNEDNLIYNVTGLDVKPEFPEGKEKLNSYINESIQKAGFKSKLKAKAYLFVVEKDGSLSDITILPAVDAAIAEELIRILKSLPKWNPGISGGKPARVYFRLPINFQLGV